MKKILKNKEINEQVWKDLKKVTLNGIKTTLESAKILLEINMRENEKFLIDHPYISAGLVTYAVEEYGKLLILQSYKPVNGKVTIEYKKLFRSHNEKFKTALGNLPKKSKAIGKSIFDPAIFDPAVFDTKPPEPSFESRKSIFYSDLDENDNIKMMPYVDVKPLKRAIERFEKIIESISLDWLWN